MSFSDEVRLQALLWSDRHCCLCKKTCGLNIEIHHIKPISESGSNKLDNAIPLCFDCHSDVMCYNVQHPKGNKYKPAELKARREQVYEEYTRHLIPPVDGQITQQIQGSDQRRTFPDVGFNLRHLGDSLPVEVLVYMESIVGDKSLPLLGDHYSGKKPWNLNPRSMFTGHFKFPEETHKPPTLNIELRVTLTIIDQYRREHRLLPVGFVYVSEENFWYAEP